MAELIDDYKSNIVSYFDNLRLDTLNIQPDGLWMLPVKSNEDNKSRVMSAVVAPYNLVSAGNHQYSKYDPQYLSDILSKIESALSDGVPQEIHTKGDGFVYPDATIDKNLKYNSLCNKPLCEKFIDIVCNFDKPHSDKSRIITYYLLGHVGSGKTTFMDHMINTNKDYFKKKNVLYIQLRYSDISDHLYKQHGRDFWESKLRNDILHKIINSCTAKLSYNMSPDEQLSCVMNIISKHHIAIFFDGFDSLSPNILETKNARHVLVALTGIVNLLKDLYLKLNEVNYECRVVFCLRKCTFDTLNADELVGRPDPNKAYLLYAAKFNEIISNIIKTLLTNNHFHKKHHKAITDIIVGASNIVNQVLDLKIRSQMDQFDNNFRRRLRYISDVIFVNAIRVSNNFYCPNKNADVHTVFLTYLRNDIIKGKKNYLYHDILVYGANTSYNNYFSERDSEHNPGKFHGFVDNIFWYFNDKKQFDQNNVFKMLIKLRVLQILSDVINDDKSSYLPITSIQTKLKKLGYDICIDHLKYVLDFLEKSLFVRSRSPYYTNDFYQAENQSPGAAEQFYETKQVIHFRCSNYGRLVLDNILLKYTYISAICQNTLLPKSISEKILYKQKKLAETGLEYFIDKNWAMSIIEYLIYFLRVLKSVELKNRSDVDYYIHEKVIADCNTVIDKILNSKNQKLTEADLKSLYNKCKYAAEYQL